MLEHHYPLCHSSTAGTIPAPREQFFHRRGGWYGPKWLDRGGRWFGPWTDTGALGVRWLRAIRALQL